MNWSALFAVLLGIGMLFFLYTSVRNNPGMFSLENISKSFGTMGLLAIALIVFVAVLVLLTRA